MTSRRVLKVAEAIREVVGMAILVDLKDPRVRDVTVTRVEVSADLRQAKVHVSVMGDDTKQRLCLKGLENSSGYLQTRLRDRIDMRYTPRLQFVLDQGVKKSIEIARILREVLPPQTEGSSDKEQNIEDNMENDDADSLQEASDIDAPIDNDFDADAADESNDDTTN